MNTSKLKARHEQKQAKLDAIKDELLQALPHGSGIDCDWRIDQHKRNHNQFYCHNSFHAMDENGFYCGWYDFTALVQYNGHGKYSECQYCKGAGYRTVAEIQSYHPGMSLDECSAWLQSTGHNIKADYTFTCDVCNGSGKLAIHPFELLKVNFHGQKERSESWGLFDYIRDTISDVLSLTE